jgi:aspartyl-tRNA synthetase
MTYVDAIFIVDAIFGVDQIDLEFPIRIETIKEFSKKVKIRVTKLPSSCQQMVTKTTIDTSSCNFARAREFCLTVNQKALAHLSSSTDLNINSREAVKSRVQLRTPHRHATRSASVWRL